MTNSLLRPSMRTVAMVVALVVLLAAFGVRIWRADNGVPVPALLQNLEASRDQASQDAFIRRLQDRFPVGSAEADLVRELQVEGFQVRAAQREASFDRRSDFNDICRRGGNVHWTADAAGRVGSVTGGYYVHCP